MLSKYVSHSRPLVSQAALLVLHDMLTSGPEHAVGKLSSVSSPPSILQTLFDIIRRTCCGANTPAVVDTARAQLAIWCLVPLLPYSCKQLTTCLPEALGILVDALHVPECTCACGSVLAIRAAITTLLQCMFALFPHSLLAFVRALPDDARGRCEAFLLKCNVHAGLLLDPITELDGVRASAMPFVPQGT